MAMPFPRRSFSLRRAAVMPCAALLAAASFAAPAQARPGIDGVRFDPPVTVRYRCDGGKQLTARYFNSADNQIAILRLDGKPLLFVTVLSASGARYAHGQHVCGPRATTRCCRTSRRARTHRRSTPIATRSDKRAAPDARTVGVTMVSER